MSSGVAIAIAGSSMRSISSGASLELPSINVSKAACCLGDRDCLSAAILLASSLVAIEGVRRWTM